MCSSDLRHLHFVDDGVRLHSEGFFERVVAAVRDIGIETVDIRHIAVLV